MSVKCWSVDEKFSPIVLRSSVISSTTQSAFPLRDFHFDLDVQHPRPVSHQCCDECLQDVLEESWKGSVQLSRFWMKKYSMLFEVTFS